MPPLLTNVTPQPAEQGMLQKMMQYELVAYPAATYTATATFCQLPVVNGLVAVPLASAMTRNAVLYTLTSAGQSCFQSLTIQVLAESTAANLVTQGYAPIIIGTTAAGTVCAAYIAYKVGDYAYNVSLSHHETLMLEAMEQNKTENNVIKKETLQEILDTYKTQSMTRGCLKFFIGNEALEITLIKKFLKDNEKADYINLNDLAKAICKGKQPRIEALTNHEKIVNKSSRISGTDKIINEIIERSTSQAELITLNSHTSITPF